MREGPLAVNGNHHNLLQQPTAKSSTFVHILHQLALYIHYNSWSCCQYHFACTWCQQNELPQAALQQDAQLIIHIQTFITQVIQQPLHSG